MTNRSAYLFLIATLPFLAIGQGSGKTFPLPHGISGENYVVDFASHRGELVVLRHLYAGAKKLEYWDPHGWTLVGERFVDRTVKGLYQIPGGGLYLETTNHYVEIGRAGSYITMDTVHHRWNSVFHHKALRTIVNGDTLWSGNLGAGHVLMASHHRGVDTLWLLNQRTVQPRAMFWDTTRESSYGYKKPIIDSMPPMGRFPLYMWVHSQAYHSNMVEVRANADEIVVVNASEKKLMLLDREKWTETVLDIWNRVGWDIHLTHDPVDDKVYLLHSGSSGLKLLECKDTTLVEVNLGLTLAPYSDAVVLNGHLVFLDASKSTACLELLRLKEDQAWNGEDGSE